MPARRQIRGWRVRFGRTGVGSVCAALLLLGLVSPASAAGPALSGPALSGPALSGNAKTIAFYRAVVAATRRTAGVEEVQTGYSAIGDAAGTASTFSMVSAAGVLPAGYVRAVEHITIANDDGHVLWLSDDLVPAACGPKAVGSCLPIAVLLLPGGAFWHFGSAVPSAARGSCWGTLSGAAVDGYTQTGAAYGYDLYGRFSPMHRVGGSELVTSIFPWGTAQTATEVDTVPVTTHLPTVGAVHISTTPGHPGFSYRWTNHWLTTALPVPRVTLCDG